MPLWYHYMDENGHKINSDGQTERDRDCDRQSDRLIE